MNDVTLFSVLFFGIWALVGIVFLMVGLGMRFARRRKEIACVMSTTGTVKAITWSNGVGYPVIEYGVNRLTYEQRLSSGSSRVKHAIGERVTVFYAPEDPTRFFVENDRAGRIIERVFIGVGLGCILIGFSVAVFARVGFSAFATHPAFH